MLWPFVIVTVIALAVVLYTEYRATPNLALHAIAKGAASAGFIGAAIAAGAFDTLYGKTLFLALAWCFVGDLLLVAKGSRPAFMFGIAAFLMGHVGYIMVFRMRGVDLTAVLVSGAGMALVAWVIWRWLFPYLQGGMRAAVMIYIAVITLMVAFAVGTVVATPAALPLVAAVLFWLSDITVARQRFVKPSFWNRALGLPLYYAAQFLFVGLLAEVTTQAAP